MDEARVTRIINDVKVVGGNATRPAVLSDQVKSGNGVRTGVDSRAELTFQDLSITRLGANTVFSFSGAGRTVTLGDGAVLVGAPPNSPAINVHTAAFSAAVSGGTALIEFHLGGVSKVLTLEGQTGVTPDGHPNEVIVVTGGNMITLGPDGKWSKPQKFNVALVMESSKLTATDEFGPLPNDALILQVIDQQQNDFGHPNSEPPHDTTLDATVDRADASPPDQGGQSPPPPPPPGNIPVITSPDPYVITSGTTITTDPTITTNGQTDQGALYHGAAIDGPLSAFLFDSTSGFDVASGFDQVLPGEDGGAGFKFTNLQLTGNPTVDITNGPDSLGLIALNGITSGGPGGNITFANARSVLLAAQNGSVTLGSELSFSGMHDLTIYARGDNSDLTLGSNMNPEEHANLFAQRDMSISSTINSGQFYAVSGRDMTINGTDTIQADTMTVTSFGNLTWTGETSDRTAEHGNGEVTIQAVGNIDFTNDLSITRHSFGSDGLNLTLTSGGNTTVGGILSFVVDNTNDGSIDTGGNIAVTVNGNLTVNGAAGIELDVRNNGGHIGTGGNVSVSAGGNLTAEGLDALIISGDGGTIDHGVTINVSAGNGLNLDFGSQFIINTSAQGSSNGGTIGGDALIQVTAGSVSTPNSNNLWFISNNDGGHIQGNATLSVSIAGNASFGDGGLFDIENHSVNTLSGGAIDNNAVIDFSAGDISAGDASLTFQILNQGNGDGAGGQIGGDATITIHSGDLASGSGDTGDINALINNHSGTISGSARIDLTATGAVGSAGANTVSFSISNSNFGQIGGDAAIHATMASLGSGNNVDFSIDNTGGAFIGGGATVNVTVTGANGVNLANQATLEVDNTGFVGGIQPHEGPPPPPTGINGDATVALDVQHGGLMDDDGLEVRILNDSNLISGSATVSANVANDLQINAGDANFEIFNDSGTIGGSASVSAAAGSISANNVFAQINNDFGSITGSATVTLNVTGDVTTSDVNGVQLYLLNEGGTIGSGGGGHEVSYVAGGTTTTQVLQTYIDNSNGGVIATGGNQFMHTGAVVLNGPLGMEFDNYNGGSVTTGGNVTAQFEGNVTDTAGDFHSLNFYVLNGSGFFNPTATGGTIGTGGNVTVTFDDDASTTGNATQGAISVQIQNGNGGSITTGGNISFSGGGNVSSGPLFIITDNQGGNIGTGGNMTFHANDAVTTAAQAVFEILNNGGTIGSIPEVHVDAGSFNVTGLLLADIDNETGNVGPGGTGTGILTLQSDGAITVGTGMWVLGTVTAGGDVTANSMHSTDVTTSGNIIVGSGGIGRFQFLDGNNTMPDVVHTLTAAQITSTGGVNFNGINSDGSSAPTDGGALVLNANSLSFGPSGDIQGSVTANGGNAPNDGSKNPAGNGGSLTVNTSGDITVNSDIEATTGYQDADAPPSGNGGSVTLKSTGGLVTVNNRIEVSSNDPTPELSPAPPIRRSDRGGTILLESDLTTGQGITIGANAQLLSLLNGDAVGPGGSITLSTMGAAITISPNATIQADRGTITIDQSDPVGPIPAISIEGATLVAAALNIHGAGDVNFGDTSPSLVQVDSMTVATTGSGSVNAQFGFLTASPLDAAALGSGLTLNGHAEFATNVPTGASVSNGANLTLNVNGDYTNNSQTDHSILQVTNQGHIGTGGNISVDIGRDLIATGPGSLTDFPEPGDFSLVLQNTNARIDTGGNINLTVGRNVNVNGLQVYLQNYDETATPAGQITNSGGNIDVEVTGNLNANHYVDVFLNNRGGGFIGAGGNLTFKVGGDLTIGDGFTEFVVSSRYDDFAGNTASSEIDSNVAVLVQAANISIAGDMSGSGISNRLGSQIFGNATVTWNVPGNLMIGGGVFGNGWFILNDCPVDVNDASALQSGGTIFGNATMTLTIGEDFSVGSDAVVEIRNLRSTNSMGSSGGLIDGDAKIDVSAANLSVGGDLFVHILNQNRGIGAGTGGSITGDATITATITGNLTTTGESLVGGLGDATFEILNQSNVPGPPGDAIGGTIGGNATMTITAGDISTAGDFTAQIANARGGQILADATVQIGAGGFTANSIFSLIDNTNGGTINGNAGISAILSGDLTTQFDATFLITNLGGGTIANDATMTVTAADLSASSLVANIDNSGGTIGGNATVNMNVSGDAEITGDANIEIIGNDPTGSAAININGGNYGVGGQFYTTIDGNGTLTFNSVNVNADTIKAAVFGTNGTLIVGGGSLNANTELKLYAPGSNGSIQFNASVTLNGGSTAAIIAANTVTIDNGVTVTIGGSIAAQVYANNRNYVGGGTGSSSTGVFDGAGVVNNALGGQPEFNSGGGASSTASSRTATVGRVRVNNSSQLLSMADGAPVDSAGRTVARASNRTNRSSNSRRRNVSRAASVSRNDVRNTLTNSTALKTQ